MFSAENSSIFVFLEVGIADNKFCDIFLDFGANKANHNR